MKDDPVPIHNHISRCCFASRCTEEGQVTGAAFQPRETDEYLSVNWLEYLQQTNRQEEIQEVRKILSLKLTLTPNAKIAVLNVGDILDHVQAKTPDNRSLKVLHVPEENDPSHSGIYGFTFDDPIIADLIAEVVQETHPSQEP